MTKDKVLHCVLKKQWFEKIKSGEKTHEYRKVTEYWYKRIYSEMYGKLRLYFLKPVVGKVCFSLGMSKASDKRMLFEIKNITVIDSKDTDLPNVGLVYDIELGERLE